MGKWTTLSFVLLPRALPKDVEGRDLLVGDCPPFFLEFQRLFGPQILVLLKMLANSDKFRTELSINEKSGYRNTRKLPLTKLSARRCSKINFFEELERFTMQRKVRTNLLSRIMAVTMLYQRFWCLRVSAYNTHPSVRSGETVPGV